MQGSFGNFSWRSRRQLHRVVATVVAGLGFMGTNISAQQIPTFPTLPPDLVVGQGRSEPCLHDLQGTVLCGRFRVYENRDTRRGRTIDLAFVVLKAIHDRGHGDAYTQFNGGPGVGATSSASSTNSIRTAIREDRDILLVDHRGTGRSAPLLCDNPFPRGIPSRFETVFPLDHVDACREMLAQRADLSQYTSINAMDDLAELTAWLGYDQLDLSGGSYGSREAQIFVRRHPEMVRTVVLNGVAPVHERVYLHHARDLQAALDNLLAECKAQTDCSAAYPDLESVLREVLATAVDDPPTVLVQNTAVPFGIGPLSYALRGLLYGRSGSVPARLYGAHTGSWQALASYYLSRQAWVGGSDGTPAGYHFSVLCAEDIDPLSWDEIARETAGTFMGDFLIAGYKRVCERWPSAKLPQSYFAPVYSDKPALLLSGGRDPVTPVSGANAVAGHWPNSLHIVVPNGGHGQGGNCINQMILKLVATASVKGIDVTCVRSRPPTRFEFPGLE